MLNASICSTLSIGLARISPYLEIKLVIEAYGAGCWFAGVLPQQLQLFELSTKLLLASRQPAQRSQPVIDCQAALLNTSNCFLSQAIGDDNALAPGKELVLKEPAQCL